MAVFSAAFGKGTSICDWDERILSCSAVIKNLKIDIWEVFCYLVFKSRNLLLWYLMISRKYRSHVVNKKTPINYDDNKTQKAIVLKKVINYVYLSLFGKIWFTYRFFFSPIKYVYLIRKSQYHTISGSEFCYYFLFKYFLKNCVHLNNL